MKKKDTFQQHANMGPKPGKAKKAAAPKKAAPEAAAPKKAAPAKKVTGKRKVRTVASETETGAAAFHRKTRARTDEAGDDVAHHRGEVDEAIESEGEHHSDSGGEDSEEELVPKTSGEAVERDFCLKLLQSNLEGCGGKDLDSLNKSIAQQTKQVVNEYNSEFPSCLIALC